MKLKNNTHYHLQGYFKPPPTFYVNGDIIYCNERLIKILKIIYIKQIYNQVFQVASYDDILSHRLYTDQLDNNILRIRALKSHELIPYVLTEKLT